MDENLLGYLLNALEPDELRQVETQLRTDPAARQKLQRLRQVLEPLAIDLQPAEPPGGLWVRTLARVAEHQCHRLPAAPTIPLSRSPAAARSWWRRADVLVAASLLLCLTVLLPPGINYARNQYHAAACKNNLRQLYLALKDYSERHDGDFPNVATAAAAP